MHDNKDRSPRRPPAFLSALRRVHESRSLSEEAIKKSKFVLAKCRLTTGSVSGIIVLDLSVAGCMIDTCALAIRPRQRILIQLPSLAYSAARVLWVEEKLAGLEFEQPLYGPVLDHLLRVFSMTPQP